ncbi:amidohydrolase [Nocardioides sp. KIGAM211]|uniref:Amidohydrolase n=1 Tax=Nocardioides luti TaxID=2761101 RepID=A0A7X0V9C6_9ACTN|nr:amidohydrolase [Nocardioides luti]MBB6626519.1 amidohydrolase [Nocardioides luti]
MSTVVLRNGTLFDGRRHLGPGAVVVRDGRIVEVVRGGFETVARATSPDGDVEVVDLAGGLLAPGFVDAHVHAVQGGLERIRCDLSGGETREEYLATIAAYAAAHPHLPWILGGGWAMSAFPGGAPTAADLDTVVRDRPVFLPNRDHHGAWVNSRALELAGVGADTPDPPHGRFERGPDGVPTGTLHEGAMAVVARHVPPTSDGEYDAALLAGQSYLHSLGVTGWQDAIVGAYAGMDDPGPVYRRADDRGDLTAYVVGALWWDRDRGLEQVPDLVARRAAYSRGRFHATSVKVMQDGVAENGTAALTAPYLDRCGHATTNTGHSFVDPLALREYAAALVDAGFQIHVHAIGDRGAREALDALAAAGAGARPGGDLRHHVAHLQLVHPDDVARFAELGVAANAQALWACLDEQMTELTLPFLGPERSAWQYPFGALHRAGARLVMGSDWPVSTPDPLAAIHTAVTRTTHGDPGRAGTEAFLPEQAVDLTTAFAAYTSGSAWINHRDDAGVLAPGAVADLVVLDRDPFAGPPEEIGATRVVSTWVEGVRVFPGPGPD